MRCPAEGPARSASVMLSLQLRRSQLHRLGSRQSRAAYITFLRRGAYLARSPQDDPTAPLPSLPGIVPPASSSPIRDSSTTPSWATAARQRATRSSFACLFDRPSNLTSCSMMRDPRLTELYEQPHDHAFPHSLPPPDHHHSQAPQSYRRSCSFVRQQGERKLMGLHSNSEQCTSMRPPLEGDGQRLPLMRRVARRDAQQKGQLPGGAVMRLWCIMAPSPPFAGISTDGALPLRVLL